MTESTDERLKALVTQPRSPGAGARTMAEMHIKIVPTDDPNAKGHWITVDRKTERFLGWKATEKLYSSCIPEGYKAISFARDPRNRW